MSALLSCCALWHFIICAWEWCPGVLELFFDGVCGRRSETPTHIPYLRISLPPKTADLTVFLEFFANRDPFLMIFLPKKRLILQFFHDFGETEPSSKDFLTKMGPMSMDFWWKSNPFGRHIPVCLNMWVLPPPHPGMVHWSLLRCTFLKYCTVGKKEQIYRSE